MVSNLDNTVDIFGTDGLVDNLPQPIKRVLIKDGEMEEVCEEVLKVLKTYSPLVKPNIMIVGGSFNLSLYSNALGGLIPLGYLRRNWETVLQNLSDTIMLPLCTLREEIQSRKGSLMVASLIPRLVNKNLKVTLYGKLLQQAYEKVNAEIHTINKTSQGKSFYLGEKLGGQRAVMTRYFSDDKIHLNKKGQHTLQKCCARMIKQHQEQLE